MNKKLAILGGLVSLLVMAGVAQAAITVDITQNATVNNKAKAEAETGENYQKKSVQWSEVIDQNGNQIITTGDANADADALAVVNKNELDITQRVEATRNHGYYNCEKDCEYPRREDPCDCVDVDVTIDSTADVNNKAKAEAETGDNTQKLKVKDAFDILQNGVQDILTGDADSYAMADQYTNTNDLRIDARSVRTSRYSNPEL